MLFAELGQLRRDYELTVRLELVPLVEILMLGLGYVKLSEGVHLGHDWIVP